MHYVALGDSSGVGIGAHDGRGGYVERLASRLRTSRSPAVTLTNLCTSGATSLDVLARQVPRLAGMNAPTLVTLLVGVNDLWRRGEPVRFATTFRDIAGGIERAWSKAAAPPVLAVATLPDMSRAPAAAFVERQFGIPRAAIGSRIQAYNEAIRQIVAARGWLLVDLGREPLTGQDDLFSPDGFHPSAAGYERMAQVFHDVLGALPGALDAATDAAPHASP